MRICFSSEAVLIHETCGSSFTLIFLAWGQQDDKMNQKQQRKDLKEGLGNLKKKKKEEEEEKKTVFLAILLIPIEYKFFNINIMNMEKASL